uniref:ubiquitinyl hydrolase 1 n=1 Tax=Arion vulgaris TaxID=1028688 RepID=A0A0B6Z235_9EUPU
METIFHEKQEGSLCAQHCLNALLQNQYFSAVDLAQIGRRLDDRERDRMAEGGIGTNEYQRFIEEPSSNYDDSGFFSVQVITEALSVWGLDMVLYNSQDPISVQARTDPTQMSAFICNYHQHWFSVRKLGHQWFNLNSLLSGPELISDTYLSLFLTQLQQEGYSIFIVTGALPECEADQLLRLMPAVQTVKPKLLTEKEEWSGGNADDGEDSALTEALRASRELVDSGDAALQRALQLSLEAYKTDPVAGGNLNADASGKGSTSGAPSTSSYSQPSSQDDLRQKRLAALDKQGSGNTTNTIQTSEHCEHTAELTEEELLEKAIAMSMQSS